MTIDRAIEILNPEHREHYESIDPVNEACRMGMEALERARWECQKAHAQRAAQRRYRDRKNKELEVHE